MLCGEIEHFLQRYSLGAGDVFTRMLTDCLQKEAHRPVVPRVAHNAQPSATFVAVSWASSA